ncbi:MAG: hypothetical protein ABSE48_14900 [Verrucomicrobiota bacterium]
MGNGLVMTRRHSGFTSSHPIIQPAVAAGVNLARLLNQVVTGETFQIHNRIDCPRKSLSCHKHHIFIVIIVRHKKGKSTTKRRPVLK